MNNIFIALILALLAGCQGDLSAYGDPSEIPKNEVTPVPDGEDKPSTKIPVTVDDEGRVAFPCEADTLQNLQLRKLTLAQTIFATQDLLTTFGREDLSDQAAENLVTWMPPDSPTPLAQELKPQTGELGFKRLDQNLDQLHVNGIFDFGLWIGEALSTNNVFGDCAYDNNASNNDACFEEFLNDAGALIMRRPLDADDKTFFKMTFDKYQTGDNFSQDATTAVLAAMFTSPDFFYVLELENPLNEFALANRIALHFWQSVPDTDLYDAAREGTLSANLDQHIDRVFDDPKTSRSLEAFYNEWFWGVETIPKNIDRFKNDPRYTEFADGADIPDDFQERARRALVETSIKLTRDGATFTDFFESNQVFSEDPVLQNIYGINWDGSGDAPEAPGRSGLLTRVALVGSGDASTRPIRKGFFIRQGLLCEIPPAPGEFAEEAQAGIPLIDDMTTRERVEAITEVGACAGCHLSYLNGLGFITENYDGFGRLRTDEKLFDEEGIFLAEKLVNTSADITVLRERRTIESIDQLVSWLGESGAVHACFSRQYFRFSMGRGETAQDSCALESMRSISFDQPISAVMKTMAKQSHFVQRAAEETE